MRGRAKWENIVVVVVKICGYIREGGLCTECPVRDGALGRRHEGIIRCK